MTSNAFGFRETAGERAVRLELERMRRLDDIFRISRYQNMIAPLARHVDQWAQGIRLEDPTIAMQVKLQADADRMRQMLDLTTSAWAASVRGTAIDMALREARIFDEQRKLGALMAETFQALGASRPILSAAMKTAASFDSLKKMLTGIAPQMMTASAIAERMRQDELLTVRLSAGPDDASTMTRMAERVVEMQRIAEAISETTDAEEGSQLFGHLLDTVAEVEPALWPRLVAEWKELGLIGQVNTVLAILGFVMGVIGLYMALEPPALDTAERAGLDALGRHIEALEKGAHHYREREAEAEIAYLAALDRAEIVRPAAIRLEPKRGGALVWRAPPGSMVVIAQRQGRWRKIVFRDPLSGQLSRGWVYGTALGLRAPLEGQREGAAPANP